MDIEQRFHKLLLVLLLLCIPDGLCIVPDEDYIDEPSFNRCPWIRNKLKNGRVRYRYKGRVAKFLCDSGFELAGKRSSTCVRGQWSNPVPVCVARGCGRLPSLLNGRITEMYRGAFLVYDCNPGYMLDGNPTNHCNGRTWYTSTPLCVVATENPETQCDFENPDLCGWSHDPNHDFDWQRNQFSTPSGHVGTGPAFDHTFGEKKGGFYLFIEASSPRKINDTARLFSPVYPKELSGGCFTFWYHMYGATTGRLRVYLKPESHVFDELKPNWEKIGDQGNQWLKGHIIVPVLHENFQIVIEGVRGESYVGDSAIDDVRLTTNLCDTDDNSTDITEAVDQYSCRGRCQESGSESSCGCNPNCVDEANFCCRDYYTICTAGNSTATPNSEEPLAEDYMTTSSVSALSSTYTPVKSSAEDSNITTELTTEKLEPTSDTFSVIPSTISSTYISQVSNTSTTISSVSPISYSTLNISSTKYSTDTQPATIPDKMLSTSLKTEASTSSTTVLVTTERFLPNNSLVTENSAQTLSTVVTLNAIISSTTSAKVPTTISTTTPSTSTITTTTPFSTTATTTAFSTSTQTSPKTTNTISSTFPTTLKSTTKTDPMTVVTNNFTTITKNISSYATDFHTTSSAAAITLKSEPTNLSTSLSSTTVSSTTMPSTTESTVIVPLITELSTRKIYNLRPRTRTISIATASSVSSTSQTSPKSTTSLKDATSTISSTTRASYLTSWYRYTVSPKTQQFTSTLVIREKTSIPDTSTRSYARWETTVETIPQTTKFFDRIRKPTESNLPKSSELYGSDSSKAKTTSNNSSVPVVVSIIIITLICLIAGLAYYLRRKRSKRQSKLSDDSEMRFLEENDYMEYSDASVLDKILEK